MKNLMQLCEDAVIVWWSDMEEFARGGKQGLKKHGK